MDTPTRERIAELEARIAVLEAEVAELRGKLGAVTSGPSQREVRNIIDRQLEDEEREMNRE